MWELVRVDIEAEKSVRNEKWFSALQNTVKYLFIISKYAFLGVFMVVLASHEVVKPVIGEEGLEYYHEEFRRGAIQYFGEVRQTDSVQPDLCLVEAFYKTRNYEPAWTINFQANGNLNAMLKLIGESHHYGLLPSYYSYHELKAALQDLQKDASLSNKKAARLVLEEMATTAALTMMQHISSGVRENDTTKAYREFVSSLPAYLNQVVRHKSVRNGILDLQPRNKQYTELQHALSGYLYKAFNDTLTYTVSDLEGNFEAISNRLILQGYMDKTFRNDTVAIINALNHFQRVHFLEESETPDEKTLTALARGTREKFYQIALNLDRIRKDELTNTNAILVNIPEFRLHYYNAAGEELDFRVVVGKSTSPTPLIRSQLETIVTNPSWTVPRSITRNELLPRIKKDSLYLEKNGYSIVDNYNETIDASSIDWETLEAKDFNYWFRQEKINNALGVVKFLFPNDYSVYLHDTPSKSLFNKTIRAYSHGCVRVENPQDLAQALVENHTKSKEDVKKVIRQQERKEIEISESVSIFIRYYSCTADSLGTIYYHPDIYSQDEQAINDLFAQSNWN
ncbi:MAG: L,D-transpeptidase family protein [Bacteroidales bacterium]|nr:L,D-transpeptidase family protein [Bacteroidales bacterium]